MEEFAENNLEFLRPSIVVLLSASYFDKLLLDYVVDHHIHRCKPVFGSLHFGSVVFILRFGFFSELLKFLELSNYPLLFLK